MEKGKRNAKLLMFSSLIGLAHYLTKGNLERALGITTLIQFFAVSVANAWPYWFNESPQPSPM